MRYLLAIIALTLWTADSSACHRAGPARRLLAAEVRLATAPLRAVAQPRAVVRTRTVVRQPAPAVVVVPTCPGGKCPAPKK